MELPCHPVTRHLIDLHLVGVRGMSQATPFEQRLGALTRDITDAATAFEARWTTAALRRHHPEIGERLHAQVLLWHAAVASGATDAIERQGAAMVRGYRKAVEMMSIVEPEAYVVGRCPDTGLTVVIGHCPATAQAAAEAEGSEAIHLTPDEVANLLPKLSGFATIAAIKRAFPGALAIADVDRVHGV